MIAALYVETGGVYYGLPDVDPWDEERDARLYAGPWPVVAHPPCARWGLLAPWIESRLGHRRGADGGCFAHALEAVRQWGGVLEHPAYSSAWDTFGLTEPATSEGWTLNFCGGWTTKVEQGNYGHVLAKSTWLYAYGVDPPAMEWGRSAGLRGLIMSSGTGERRKTELSETQRVALTIPTPLAFRDALLGIARSSLTSPHSHA